ncbi:craniofacial development protein 2-like [Sitophilus oryzae]|uniref:Craniofacial development protein 2-like n=1 Tax=Sitophilus oryzae TaxID=7048 RepID=A0A6J2X7X6_SITOR|nr:craniofacial development protein 2-like [Sitophilus oryzae]
MANRNERLSCDPDDDRRCLASRASSVKLATGHVDVDLWASRVKCTTRSHGHVRGREVMPARNQMQIATWNIRGAKQVGKLKIILNEISRCTVNICGLSETHWKGNGHYKSENYTIYYSGQEDGSSNGVAFAVSDKINKYVVGYEAVSSRIITMRLSCKPCNLNLIQIHAPTTDADDGEIEGFYTSLETVFSRFSSKEVTIIMGDFNSKIGETIQDNHIRSTVGKYGLGIRNERGERLIQFCLDNNLSICNSLFQQRRLYTWTSPNGIHRNQIDYILIKNRWRSSILSTKTLPEADCGSDHQLLQSTFRLKLKVPNRKVTRVVPPLINNEAFRERLENELNNQQSVTSSIQTST